MKIIEIIDSNYWLDGGTIDVKLKTDIGEQNIKAVQDTFPEEKGFFASFKKEKPGDVFLNRSKITNDDKKLFSLFEEIQSYLKVNQEKLQQAEQKDQEIQRIMEGTKIDQVLLKQYQCDKKESDLMTLKSLANKLKNKLNRS